MALSNDTTKSGKATTRRRRASIETKDVAQEVETDIDLSSSVDDVDRPDLAMVTGEDLNSPNVKQYTQELAFMNDELTIMVSEVSDENAENPVSAGVNGEIKHFIRGQEYKVKRMFVDSLIKTENKITTKNYKDDDNCEQTKVISKAVMKYPISIIRDPAGEAGSRWFKFCCNN